MTHIGSPTAAELAALMDGTLPDAERVNLIARIERDPDLRAIYADAVAIASDLDDSTSTTPFRARASGKPWYARASTWGAGVALAASLFIAVMMRGDGEASNPESVAFAAINAVRGAPSVREWKPVPSSTLRGSSVNTSDDRAARTVRLGMLLIDYQHAEGNSNVANLRQAVAQELDGIAGLSHLSPQVMRDQLGAQTIAQAVSPHVDMNALSLGTCVELALLRGPQAANDASCAGLNSTHSLAGALMNYLNGPVNESRAALEAARDRVTMN